MLVRINAARRHTRVGPADLAAHLAELLRQRGVAWVLVARELRARYRSSALGYLWTLLNPLLHLGIYTLVFSVFLRVEVEDYPLFLFAGLLPWTWLSASLGTAATSLHEGANLVTRSLLAPQLLPTVRVVENGLNLLFTLPVLLGVALVVGRPPGASWLAIPLLFAIELCLVQGLCLVTAALCARFRDVEFLVRHLLTFWLYLTPILYPLEKIPESLRALAFLNPMTPLALAWQDALYRGRFPDAFDLVLALAWGLLSLAVGLVVFERLRDRLVEEL